MLKRLGGVEKNLMGIYAEIKKTIPALTHLSFEISTYASGKTSLSGFYFINKSCHSYRSLADLAVVISKAKERRAKKGVLYQRFEGVLR